MCNTQSVRPFVVTDVLRLEPDSGIACTAFTRQFTQKPLCNSPSANSNSVRSVSFRFVCLAHRILTNVVMCAQLFSVAVMRFHSERAFSNSTRHFVGPIVFVRCASINHAYVCVYAFTHLPTDRCIFGTVTLARFSVRPSVRPSHYTYREFPLFIYCTHTLNASSVSCICTAYSDAFVSACKYNMYSNLVQNSWSNLRKSHAIAMYFVDGQLDGTRVVVCCRIYQIAYGI